jgi:nitrate reductase cytochrome c-type subunit
MNDAVLSALITGVLTLIGVVVSNLLASKKTEQAIAVNQAVTDTKIEELTREVREHNNFALRMPVVEHNVKDLQRRVDVLENYHKQPIN